MQPVLHSLLETDLYKFTMWQAMLHRHPQTQAEYIFICRNARDYPLTHLIAEINEQLDHLCTLRFQPDELAYLRSLRFIKSDFARAIRIDQARSVIAAAEKKMQTTEPPSGKGLPIEPERPFDDEALKEAAKRRTGNLAPYSVKGADFDVSLLTPVLVYGARHPPERVPARERGRDRDPSATQSSLRALEDFANWEDYVRDDPPVLMIRATPKLVESLWKTIARGAAQTQGISIPAIKSIKARFSRMQVFCGVAEITPIHPFRIEHRVSANDSVFEGLYVFDPGAIGPHCGTVKLMLFSDKNPGTGDARVIDPKIVEQIWQDFAPYRAGA